MDRVQGEVVVVGVYTAKYDRYHLSPAVLCLPLLPPGVTRYQCDHGVQGVQHIGPVQVGEGREACRNVP